MMVVPSRKHYVKSLRSNTPIPEWCPETMKVGLIFQQHLFHVNLKPVHLETYSKMLVVEYRRYCSGCLRRQYKPPQRNLQTKLPKTNTKKSLKESSLENLLEIYEEQIQERSYKQGKQDNDFLTQTYFVSTSNMEHPKPNKKRVKVIAQGFQQKTRILKRFIGIFFSVA